MGKAFRRFFFLIHRARGCRKPWCKNRGRGITGRCPSKIFLFPFIKHAVLNGKTVHTKGCLENRCELSSIWHVFVVLSSVFVVALKVSWMLWRRLTRRWQAPDDKRYAPSLPPPLSLSLSLPTVVISSHVFTQALTSQLDAHFLYIFQNPRLFQTCTKSLRNPSHTPSSSRLQKTRDSLNYATSWHAWHYGWTLVHQTVLGLCLPAKAAWFITNPGLLVFA